MSRLILATACLFQFGCDQVVRSASTQPANWPTQVVDPKASAATQPTTQSVRIDDAEFARIPLVADGPLTINLLYRPIANPADERFIGFELVNHSDQTITVTDAKYRISYTIDDSTKRDQLLVQGNHYDFLYRDMDATTAKQRPPLGPGTSTHLEYASGYAFSQLGIPEKANKVNAVAGLEITYVDVKRKTNRTVFTPQSGVAFAFEWRPPADAQLHQMQVRLRDLVRDSDERQAAALPLIQLLSDPRIAKEVTTDDLIAGLRARGQIGRVPLVEYISKHFPDHPAIKDAYVAAVGRGDRWWVWDLASGKLELKDVRLIAPLVERLKAPSPQIDDLALRALYPQIPLADDPYAIAKVVSSVVVARSKFVKDAKLPTDEQSARKCQEEITQVWLSRDPAASKYIEPYLGCELLTYDPRIIAVANSQLPMRLCDVAYNTILELRAQAANRRMPELKPFPTSDPTAFRVREDAWTDIFAKRDRQIARLKQILEAESNEDRLTKPPVK